MIISFCQTFGSHPTTQTGIISYCLKFYVKFGEKATVFLPFGICSQTSNRHPHMIIQIHNFLLVYDSMNIERILSYLKTNQVRKVMPWQ